jgi:hypothetical protein
MLTVEARLIAEHARDVIVAALAEGREPGRLALDYE